MNIPAARIGLATDGDLFAALVIKMPKDAWLKVVEAHDAIGIIEEHGGSPEFALQTKEEHDLLGQVIHQVIAAFTKLREDATHKELAAKLAPFVPPSQPVRKIRKR